MNRPTSTLRPPTGRHLVTSVVTLSLELAFIALVAVCVFALGTIVSVVVRPSMSQVLRLNED